MTEGKEYQNWDAWTRCLRFHPLVGRSSLPGKVSIGRNIEGGIIHFLRTARGPGATRHQPGKEPWKAIFKNRKSKLDDSINKYYQDKSQSPSAQKDDDPEGNNLQTATQEEEGKKPKEPDG